MRRRSLCALCLIIGFICGCTDDTETPDGPDWTFGDTSVEDTSDVDLEVGPTTEGACCRANACAQVQKTSCDQIGGTFHPGESCQQADCSQQGEQVPCCISTPFGSQCAEITAAQCDSADGEILTVASCAESSCGGSSEPQACCTQGTCSTATPNACRRNLGTPQGAGSTCADTTCPEPKPCCIEQLGAAACRMAAPSSCSGLGGETQDGADCGQAPCGGGNLSACCVMGQCINLSTTLCSQSGGSPESGSVCSDIECP
jgi:hypothetical protein